MEAGKRTGTSVRSGRQMAQRGSKRKVLEKNRPKRAKREKLALSGAPDGKIGPEQRAKLWAEFTQTDICKAIYRQSGLDAQAAFQKWLTARKL